MEALYSWQAWLGVFLIGLSKGGFATGLGMLTTPLMASALPAKQAIGVILPLLCLADLVTIGFYWKKWNFQVIVWPLIGTGVGILSASFFIGAVPDLWLKKSIGILGLILTLLLIIRNLWYPQNQWHPAAWQAFLIGMAAGVSSTLSHAAGPIMAIYLMALQLPKIQFVATSALFFTVNNWLKLPPYFYLDLINIENLRLGLFYSLMIPFGVLAGWLLQRWLPQKAFNGVVYLLMALTSIQLIL